MNITNRDLFYIRMASKMAKNLTHSLRNKHAAILVERQNIVSVGVNKMKSSPMQKQFSRLPHLNFIHAEIDCLKDVKIDNPKRVTLYVVQWQANSLGESCPCAGCTKAIRHLGIDRVVHSIKDGIQEKFYAN